MHKHCRRDQKSEVFSVICDEETDTSNTEQLAICLWYVHNNTVNEMFADFVPVERITGKVLAEAIISCLTAWVLSIYSSPSRQQSL